MSLFADKTAALKAFRERLEGVTLLGNLCKLSDSVLYAKLLAAEQEWYVKVRVFLEPTWVFPEDATQTEIDARVPSTSPYVVEAGYDYDPSRFFQAESWGMLVTRQHPIITLTSYRFTYVPRAQIYQIPLEWIRLNKKYGHVRLLPVGGQSATLPLNAFVLNVFGGGFNIPQVIRLTYKAGLEDVPTKYPAVLDFLYRVATLLLIRDRFYGSSQSLSGDGFSQSVSFDLKAYASAEGGLIGDEYKTWNDFFHGVQVIVI